MDVRKRLVEAASASLHDDPSLLPCVQICCLPAKNISANGSVKGRLINTSIGENGFGYDSYFIPINNNKTFAEMELEEKNIISHRKIAITKLKSFLF